MKLAAVMTATGAIVAAGVSFMVPKSFESSAVIQVTPRPDPVRSASAQAIQERIAYDLAVMETGILSRGVLGHIIQDPALNLYQEERRRMPLEDIILRMRSDIRIQVLPVGSAITGVAPMTFRVSFADPGREKARAVVGMLTTKFMQVSLMINQSRVQLFETFWQDQASATHKIQSVPPPTGESVAVLDPASLPDKPAAGPNRVSYLAWGLGSGLLAGLLVALAMRRPRLMSQLAGFAILGSALAVAVSFLISDRYTCTAVLMISPPLVTEDPLATPTVTPAAEYLRQCEPKVLSRAILAGIIEKPALDLYPKERAKEPLEDIIEKMRNRDIRIAAVSPQAAHALPSAFSVSFSYSDKYKAQSVVRELVAAFEEVNITQMKAKTANESATLRSINEHNAGENLEVLDPASVPEVPIAPDRLVIAVIGLAVGLLLGMITLRLTSQRHTLFPAEL